MSVIGTTLKQPRVFSHDAIALADLPGCVHRGLKNAKILPWMGKGGKPYNGLIVGGPNSDSNGGSGFIKGEIYSAIAGGARGTIFKVEVTNVTSTGEILSIDLVIDDECPQSTNLNNNEVFDIIWEPKSDQSWDEPNCKSAANVGTIKVEKTTPWDYGCPFTPLINRTIEDPSIDYPKFRIQESYKQKDIIKYTCIVSEEAGCEYRTVGPGASLYIGYDLSELTVIMESGKSATWTNIPAGSFMPISVLTVCQAIAAGPDDQDKPDADALKTLILALF